MVTMNNGNRVRTKTITADNQFTDPIFLKRGGILHVYSTTPPTSLRLQRKNPAGDWIN